MSGMMTIGQLASATGVARTTIQYYEQVGLLAPAARTEAGYRQYSAVEAERVRRISACRAAGMTLDAIRALLAGASEPDAIARRLEDINRTMDFLREQRTALLRLTDAEKALDQEAWDGLLKTTSLDDAAMHRWHVVFERQNPEAHRTFLRSLGLSDEEVERIRRG